VWARTMSARQGVTTGWLRMTGNQKKGENLTREQPGGGKGQRLFRETGLGSRAEDVNKKTVAGKEGKKEQA